MNRNPALVASPLNSHYVTSPLNSSYVTSPLNSSYVTSPLNSSYVTSPLNSYYVTSPLNSSYVPCLSRLLATYRRGGLRGAARPQRGSGPGWGGPGKRPASLRTPYLSNTISTLTQGGGGGETPPPAPSQTPYSDRRALCSVSITPARAFG